jgi:hypothetical protein
VSYTEKRGISYPLGTDKINIDILNRNTSILAARQYTATVGYDERADYIVEGSTEAEKAKSFKSAMESALEENFAVCILEGEYYSNAAVRIKDSRTVFGEGLFTNIYKICDSSEEAAVFELNGEGIELSTMTITCEDDSATSTYPDIMIRGEICRLEGINFIDHRDLGEESADAAVYIKGGYMTIVTGCRFNLEYRRYDVYSDAPSLAIGNINSVREFTAGGSLEYYGNLGHISALEVVNE